ncbi:MAG: amidohydrolase family protein [Christensenellaceae bacterium]|jgi:cytosine/adenosine deaminase-related metal-dependent hydrolase|nr:amidohydrolase family protein [Christensenellaceae bacterium]
MQRSIILHGAAVLTPAGPQPHWGLCIKDGRIAQLGPWQDLKPGPQDEYLDCKNQIILPGFINGHTHMYGVLSHGISTDAVVEEFNGFLEDFWWPHVENRISRELAELTAEWACVEMIESGTTAFFDILEAPLSLPGALESEALAVQKAGLRATLTFEACERVSAENAALGLEENAAFIRAHKADALIGGAMSIHTLFTCGHGYVLRAREMARQLGTKFHMHLSESVAEPDWCLAHLGKRPVETYAEWGVLDADVLASQLVQLNEAEIALYAKSGAGAVSMPLSNCEVGGGVAPVPALLRAGVQVGLGSDGYINSFFEVMRGAFLIHKAHLQNPQVMDAKTVFTMATAMGAKALGNAQIGALAPGMQADVITIRTDDTPTPVNLKNIYDQVVLFRNPGDVEHVFVQGRPLKLNGRLQTLDKAAIRERLREQSAQFWEVRPQSGG